MARTVLITGSYGFIGSNLCRYWLDRYPEDKVIGIDALTYAARPQWLIEKLFEENINGRFISEVVDLRNVKELERVFEIYKPDHVINLAAESHVCNSIRGPEKFIHTNIVGTFNLLEQCRLSWKSSTNCFNRFLHVSTDEVFGDCYDKPKFNEQTPYDPRSPYSASKASSDHLVKAWQHTYGLNTVITNCSNNFGPNQHLEKLIPKTIDAMLNKKPIIIYGSGEQVRDWLYVDDHCAGIDKAFHYGQAGETYCIGGENEQTNLNIISTIASLMQKHFNLSGFDFTHTNDRPTDDKRYAIDCTKIKQLGYEPKKELFMENLIKTIYWYAKRNGEYE